LSLNYALIGYRSIITPFLREAVMILHKISQKQLAINKKGYLL